MAGWTVVADEPADRCGDVKQKVEVDEFGADLNVDAYKVKDLFERVVYVIMEDTDSGIRPLPPLLGDGKCVDLFQVFIAVRMQGGFEMVTECGLWNLVGESCGLGCGVGGSLKLIYVKYLDVLEKWLTRVTESESSKGDLMKCGDETDRLLCGLKGDLGYLFSIIVDKKKKDAEASVFDLKVSSECGMLQIKDEKKSAIDAEASILDLKVHSECGTGSIKDEKTSDIDAREDVEIDDSMLCGSEVMDAESGVGENANDCSFNLDCNRRDVPDVQVDSDDSKENIVKEPDYGVKKCMNNADVNIMNQSCTSNEGSTTKKKRKRESLLGMMNWLIETAKNPCDPATGCLPERSKWKSFGNEVSWKQILSAREQLFFKQKFDSKADQEVWLRRQMHPSMYEGRTPERPRSSRKSTHANKSQLHGVLKSSQTKSEFDDSCDRRLPRIGKKYQADLPEWNSSASENDLRWLGTRVWPLEKMEKRSFFERVPSGRGKQGDCGCGTPGSVECFRFHISEKSARLKPELGSAFYYWGFDCMGEKVSFNWTADNEKELQTIVKEYHHTYELWNELHRAFPSRSKAALVSYYFNVFLLRHRADQNRHTPYYIDSDLEESEPEDRSASKAVDQTTENCSSSIYYSPKKQKKGTK